MAVAAHLLLLLPPPVQAASPPARIAAEASEAAWASLQIETSGPASQEPVEVNKTVPNVESPPQYPTFSPIPSDVELTKARVFGEPLFPEAGESNEAENQALAQAITTYLYGGDSEALEPLEGVVTAFPRSRWRVAVQANVGSWYRKKGYFTRAQRNLTEAWQLGKDSDTEGVRRLAEFAAGELMQIHMQFGQVDPLEALVTDFEGRELSGGITETLASARATVWGLRNNHGSAIPSGSVALERIRKDKHDKKEKEEKDRDPKYKKKPFERNASLDAFPATHDGASLAQIQDLADLTDLELQMARRVNSNAEIPIPALVHLKAGHFAALVEERDGRFRFDDPLLGGEVWMSREAFEEEISGFFLVEQGRLLDGWRSATRGETEPVRGKCVYATASKWATRFFDLLKGAARSGKRRGRRGGGGPGGGGPGGGGPGGTGTGGTGTGGTGTGGTGTGGTGTGGTGTGGTGTGGTGTGGTGTGGTGTGGTGTGGTGTGGTGGGGMGGGGGCSNGMASYSFHVLRASLHIYDTPLGCSAPVGPSTYFSVNYNQREATQPQTFTFSNLGPRWNLEWLSYVEDDPTAIGEPVDLYARGGGRESYEAFVSGVSAPQSDVRAVMEIVSTSPIIYERRLPNGWVEVFSQPDGAATAPRRIFLTQLRDSAGNTLTFTYDEQLRLVSATDAIGRVSTVSYELASDPLKITKATDPYDRSASFDYNDAGQLVKITDVIGLASEFEYGVNVEYQTSTPDFVRALTTPYGTTTFRTGIGPYAGLNNNRWLEATDPLGGTERVEYILAAPNPLSASDSESTVPTGFTGNANLNTHLGIYYSKLAMARSSTDPPDPEDGTITRFRSSGTFEISGYQIQSVKQPLENRVWYEQEGETIVGGVGPSGRPSRIGRVLDDGTSQITQVEYNAVGAPIRYLDPLGRESVFVYGAGTTPDADPATGTGIDLLEVQHKNGAAFETLAEFTYNSDHRMLTATNALGNTSTFTYNPEGQLLTATSPPTTSAPAGATSTLTYDEDGYLLTATGPVSGSTATYTYDDFGRLRTISPPLQDMVTFDYDDLDRLTRATYEDDTYEEVVYNRLDAEQFRDRLGRWSRLRFDVERRLVAATDPEGRTTSLQWCRCGVLEALIDANGNPTSWEHDGQGRVVTETRADSSEYTFVYESTTSRLDSVTDPRSIETSFEYFLDGRLKKKSYSDSTPDVTLTYDYRGRPATTANGTDTLSWEYDSNGRVLSESSTKNSSTVSYEYDEVGNRRVLSLDGTPFSAYGYDAALRLTSITRDSDVFAFTYDAASRRTGMLYPNGIATAYEYDTESRLERITAQLGTTVITDFQYTYNVVGNRTEKQTPELTEAYRYDRADQLVGVVRTGTAANRWAYSYDPAGNRTTEQVGNAPVQASFDDMNRLLSTSAGGALAFKGSLDEPATVTIDGQAADVDGSNEFQGTVSSSSGTNTVVVAATDPSSNTRTNTYEVEVSGTGTTYDFDANGNLIEKDDGTDVWTYEWNARNQLVEVLENETTITTYAYDPLGRRVEKVVGATTTAYTYDFEDILRETAGGTTTNYVHGGGIDEPLAKEVGTTKSYYHADALGSIIRRTTSAGGVNHDYRYDAFGRIEVGFNENGYSFTGREWDSETGLLYYRARYSAPADTGRWINEDPAGFIDGANRYVYVRNNPTNFIDPTGLVVPFVLAGAILGALLASSFANAPETADTPTMESDNAAGGLIAGAVAGGLIAGACMSAHCEAAWASLVAECYLLYPPFPNDGLNACLGLAVGYYRACRGL
jgi:RHS repeat-associated protein